MSNAGQHGYVTGKICYIEIPAEDVERSAAFYRDTFGWTIRKRGDGSTSFTDTAGQVGGVWSATRPVGNGHGLLIYLMVEDIEKSVAAVLANSGELIDPIERSTPNVVATFRDPAGNIFGLFEEPTLRK